MVTINMLQSVKTAKFLSRKILVKVPGQQHQLTQKMEVIVSTVLPLGTESLLPLEGMELSLVHKMVVIHG